MVKEFSCESVKCIERKWRKRSKIKLHEISVVDAIAVESITSSKGTRGS